MSKEIKTLSGYWERHRKSFLPPSASPEVVAACKHTFYSGAIACWLIITKEDGCDPEYLQAEIGEFVQAEIFKIPKQ